MDSSKFLKKVSELVKHTSFSKDRYHLVYSLHKMFDILERNNLTSNTFEFSDKEINMIMLRVLPPYIHYELIEDTLIWSQEYKCHFKVNCKKENGIVTFNITTDRITKPVKVFIKEETTKQDLIDSRELKQKGN